MLIRYITLLLFFILFACSTPIKKHAEKIDVESADFLFIDELLQSVDAHPPARLIDVWLTLPNASRFAPPYPAVVLLHSSWGLSSQESHYASIFKRMGIGTFAIDSFVPRGIEKTSMDQTRVSSASMLKDAYAVLDYIGKDPRFDVTRVAVMGFSKGGIVALYSAVNKIQQTLSSNDLKFAAHVAYYPWCGLQFYEMQTTGAPILIHGGSRDIVTPIKRCKNLAKNLFDKENGSNVTIKEYPSARHAFDHPVLARLPFKISMDAQVPWNCSIKETRPGQFIEEHSNIYVTHKNIAEILHRCSKYKGVAKYNRKAARTALMATQKGISSSLSGACGASDVAASRVCGG